MTHSKGQVPPLKPAKRSLCLDELDAAFGQQAEHWNDKFNRAWNDRLSSLQQAITAASDASSPMECRGTLHEKLNQLCSLYLSMDDEERAEFRTAVANRKHLLRGFREQAMWAAQRIQSHDDGEWLWAGLAAVSIEDGQIDYRDTLMNLGELYAAAEITESRASGFRPAVGGGVGRLSPGSDWVTDGPDFSPTALRSPM